MILYDYLLVGGLCLCVFGILGRIETIDKKRTITLPKGYKVTSKKLNRDQFYLTDEKGRRISVDIEVLTLEKE